MTDEITKTTRADDSDRICITCGKPGGACRWSDEVEDCMKRQLAAARAAFVALENEALRIAGTYPQSSDGRNTFMIFAAKIAETANVAV
jgi:hypothetical protein